MNVMLIAGFLGLCYIAVDLYRSHKKGELEGEGIKRSFKRFKEAVRGAETKHYAWGYVVFLFVFLVCKGALVIQDEMQECRVWIDDDFLNNYYNLDNSGVIGLVISEYREGDFFKLPSNRSYVFYRRWFNENGGRASFVNIDCNMAFDYDRFKRNILLDYNEGNIK